MKIARLILLLSAVAMLFLLSSCAELPQQAIDAAKAAVDQAKSVEADRYAMGEFNMAQDSLNAALAEVEEQNGKFALTRSYDKASQLLTAATSAASNAAQMAVENKEKVKAEVEQMMETVKNEIANTGKLMKKAPKGKEGRAALMAMKAELDAVANSQGAVDQLYADGDYMGAKDKLDAGMKKIQSLQDELNAAIMKTKR